jgi:hypothetical protein
MKADVSLQFPNILAKDAWLSASSKQVALSILRTPNLVGDAGVNGGGASDGGASAPLELYTWKPADVPKASALGSPLVSIPNVEWSSVATIEEQGWLLYGDAFAARLHRFNLNSALGPDDVPFDIAPFSKATAGAIAVLPAVAADGPTTRARGVVATVENGDILLRALRLDETLGKSSLLRSLRLSALGVVLQKKVRNTGSVAIAARGDRVAVVWSTGRTLVAGEPPGGYAVFACAP